MPAVDAVGPVRAGVSRRSCLAGLAWAIGTPASALEGAESGVSSELPLAAARYLAQGMPSKPSTTHWTLVRERQRIALAKGDTLEEIWYRDDAGRISLQRCFHSHQQVVHYSAGELTTLGVQPVWGQLGRLVDLQSGLLQADPGEALGSPWGAVQRLHGHVDTDRLTVDWLPAWQLPLRLHRQGPLGQRLTVTLQALAATLPAGAAQPGERAACYQFLDAADFGDMPYEPVVRLCLLLDQQQGWRTAHAH